MYKRLLSVLLALVFLSIPALAGNYGGSVTSEQESAIDKVISDSGIWDDAAEEVNADSAVWEDKYTKVEADALLDDKLDADDTPIAPITLEYKLYRIALNEAYTGYIDCQLVISDRSDYDTPVVDVDTGTAQTSWLAYGAASDSNEAWSASGMPSTDVRSIIYIGANLTRGTVYYYRWRSYKHGDSGTATDYKGGAICL